MIAVLGAGFGIAYLQSVNNSSISNQSPDTENTPTQTPTTLTQNPDTESSPTNTNQNPEPTPTKRSVPPSNEFDKVQFPQANCGDPLPTNASSPTEFYPVFIEFSDKNIQKVTTDFCRDAYQTKRQDTGQIAIQVASFTDRNQAKLFSDFMLRQLGSGEVGQATIYKASNSVKPSPNPSPTNPLPNPSPTKPSPNPSPTNPSPKNCSLVVDDPQSPLNVRSLPDVKSNSVGKLNNGEIVTSVTEQNGWIQISSPVAGWISKSRIRRICQ